MEGTKSMASLRSVNEDLFQDPDEELHALTSKKKELDKMLQDIMKLENGTTTATSTPPTEDINEHGDEYYVKLIKLERELKKKSEIIDKVNNEKATLERLAKKQEDTLHNLTKQLKESKAQISRLDQVIREKGSVDKSSYYENRVSFVSTLESHHIMSSLQESSKIGKRNKNINEDLYLNVMDLESNLREKERILKEISEENKTLHKLLQQADRDFAKLNERSSGENSKVESLEARMSELTATLVKMQQENRALNQENNSSLKHIEELTEKVKVWRRKKTSDLTADINIATYPF
jgi:vacuolar-type H+-ATPase subunit I/STV1